MEDSSTNLMIEQNLHLVYDYNANITLYLPAFPVRPADKLIYLGIVCALHLLRVPLKLLVDTSKSRQMTGEDPLSKPARRGGEVISEGATIPDGVEYLIECTASARECFYRRGVLPVFVYGQDARVLAKGTGIHVTLVTDKDASDPTGRLQFPA